LENIAKEIVAKYPGASYEFSVYEQYRNMMDILKDLNFVMDHAIEAMNRAGVKPEQHLIRGGTDGSRLSFMGLPCPNIFTGEMAIHSKHEYVSVQDMQKAIDTCVELVKVWEEKS
jgi:tripeptide aminopeptidase